MRARGRFPQRSGTNAATPTHDRVAELRQSFRQIRLNPAIAQALPVVRFRQVGVAWVVPNVRVLPW